MFVVGTAAWRHPLVFHGSIGRYSLVQRMLKALSKIASLSVLTLIGIVGLLFYRHQTAGESKIAELAAANVELKDVIGRLEAEERVAEFIVAEQSRDAGGVLVTTLFMVEYGRDGKAMPARSFAVRGERVHVDGLVIKFDAKDIQKKDPLRGHALLILEKIYGDAEPAATAATIDAPDEAPDLYRDTNPKTGTAERSLWKQFWQLNDDAELREKYGVRVAHGTGVFVRPTPGRKYTLTLQADGNTTIHTQPLPEIFGELVKRRPGG